MRGSGFRILPAVVITVLVGHTAASARPELSKGAWDIWLTVRDSVNIGFGPPRNIQELNTLGDEHPGWLAHDQCRLYFVRSDFQIGGRVYLASRVPPFPGGHQ